ncbi:MAG TPA: BON domain-containing protein [Gemmatimonadales bacterium]|nr:BON domain-containing protein [Gemmatimonadales bacterium]
MQSELELKRRVRDELGGEPSLHPAHISVFTDDGAVTLQGTVTSYAQKVAAEAVSHRVRDVRSVKNALDVVVPIANRRSDAEITQAVTRLLQWNATIPRDKIQVRVVDGWIELNGTVEWQYQRVAAEAAVQPVLGVRGVSNLIAVKPRTPAGQIRERITAALKRRADLATRDAQDVEVAADGSVVTLRGKVHSWSDRALIEAAAWGAPGVAKVEDELEVVSEEPELAF